MTPRYIEDYSRHPGGGWGGRGRAKLASTWDNTAFNIMKKGISYHLTVLFSVYTIFSVWHVSSGPI